MQCGQKPKGQVKIKWSSEFAYAIGLLVSDGCLSKDGLHITFSSKEKRQIFNFKKCLGLKSKIGKNFSGAGNLSYRVQFGDVLFYKFLQEIGLSPAKSKTISEVSVPKKYFFDYLRGYFDGDGCTYSFFDSVWKKSYRFYLSFASASISHLEWLRKKLNIYTGVVGSISRNSNHPSSIQLRYSKHEALLIVKKMYYCDKLVCLKRKRLKIDKSLNIIKSCRSGVIGKRATFRS